MSSRTRVTPRSRSVGPSRDGDDHRGVPLPSGPRITPSHNSGTPRQSQASRGRAWNTETYSSASSSSTLAPSPFLEHMKARSSEAPSRTSLDDDGGEQRGGWASARRRKHAVVEDEQLSERGGKEESDSTRAMEGYGYDLWSRVTAVAGNLTVNVSKAWEMGIGRADGEETPPGQESRLTKAMKAYHLARARSAADLPSWLFDEHERGATSRSWSAPRREDYEDRFLPEPDRRQRSGLRDIYDKTASSSSGGYSSRGVQEGSGAANRLKAIRDAKRAAVAKSEVDGTGGEDRRQYGEGRSPSVNSRPARVGLPSAPGRARRQ